jgi:hypothetical protein
MELREGLAHRVKELAERYETPLPKQTEEVKVEQRKMKNPLIQVGK